MRSSTAHLLKGEGTFNIDSDPAETNFRKKSFSYLNLFKHHEMIEEEMNAVVSSTFKVTPLNPTIGALIEGVNFNQPLTPEEKASIEAALLKYQVIFFRNQQMTPQQHAAFARQFGQLHVHPIYPNIPEQPEIMVLDTELNDLRDNALWHTDVTFLEEPAMGAILSAKKVPAWGGDTLCQAVQRLLKPYLNRCRRC